jgi:hypothetical protein
MSMTLVIGARGSIGSRWCAVLRYLREDYLAADLGDPWWEWEFDRVLIATPTDRHAQDLRLALCKGKPILCEKPIATDSREVATLAEEAKRAGVDVRMVSNWLYAVNLMLVRERGPKGKAGAVATLGEMHLSYDYYNSGKDGFWWDMIQPVYLAGKLTYSRISPVFQCTVDGMDLPLCVVEESYVLMLSEWLHGDKSKLWSLEDAVKASQKVEQILKAGYPMDKGEIDFQVKVGPAWY